MTPSIRPPRSDCPIACTLDVIGDRWTLIILRDVLLAGRERFAQFAKAERITPNILTERLRRLEAAGILDRRPDPSDGRKIRYLPTRRAVELIPTLIEVGRWGIDHTTGSAHAALFERSRHDREGLLRDLQDAAARRVMDRSAE